MAPCAVCTSGRSTNHVRPGVHASYSCTPDCRMHSRQTLQTHSSYSPTRLTGQVCSPATSAAVLASTPPPRPRPRRPASSLPTLPLHQQPPPPPPLCQVRPPLPRRRRPRAGPAPAPARRQRPTAGSRARRRRGSPQTGRCRAASSSGVQVAEVVTVLCWGPASTCRQVWCGKVAGLCTYCARPHTATTRCHARTCASAASCCCSSSPTPCDAAPAAATTSGPATSGPAAGSPAAEPVKRLASAGGMCTAFSPAACTAGYRVKKTRESVTRHTRGSCVQGT